MNRPRAHRLVALLVLVAFAALTALAFASAAGAGVLSRRARTPALEGAFRDRLLGWTAAAGRVAPASVTPGTPRLDAWHTDGVPVTTGSPPQVLPVTAPDGAGGAYIAWMDFRNFNADLFMSRLNDAGDVVSGWSAAGTAVCVADSYQVSPAIAPDASGGVFLAWTELVLGFTQQRDVFVQRITSSGTPAAGFPANGKRIEVGPFQTFQIAADGTGGLMLAYVDAEGQLRVLRLDSGAGVASGWPAAGIPVGNAGEADIDVTPDGIGGFYAVRAVNDSVFAYRWAANATVAAGWSGDGILVGQEIGASYPHVTRLASGDAMIAWEDYRNFDYDLFAVRVAADGSFPAPWAVNGVPVNTGTNPIYPYDVLSDATGGALVLWQEYDGVGTSLAVQRITGGGGVAAGWPIDGLALCPNSPNKQVSDVIADGAGGVIAAWSDTISGSTETDIYITRIAANGTRPAGYPAGGAVVCAAAFDQANPHLVTDGANGAIVAWEDQRVGVQIYAGRVLLDGTVGADAALADASAEAGVIRLHWFDPDGAFTAVLERAAAGGGFVRLADVSADATGHLRYEDRDVAAGAEYRYRLRLDDAAGRRYAGAVTLRVPDALALGVEPARPNPSPSRLTLAFTLPRAGGASLEVLDPAGRRVLERDLAAFGAGRHVIRLEAALAPGVYLVRVRQAGRAAVTRVAVAD